MSMSQPAPSPAPRLWIAETPYLDSFREYIRRVSAADLETFGLCYRLADMPDIRPGDVIEAHLDGEVFRVFVIRLTTWAEHSVFLLSIKWLGGPDDPNHWPGGIFPVEALPLFGFLECRGD